MRKKSLKNKEGSAMLIAIAIMAVLVMLGLALLLVSFSLHATANREHDAAQCKEIVQTLSRELERQITITREDAYEKGAAEKYPFWFYIRDNVWREEKWPPYGEAEYLNDRALRRLQLGQNSSETGEVVENAAELLKNTYMEAYWTREDKLADKGEGTTLVVTVSCSAGKSESSMTKTYVLSVEEIEGKALSDGEFVPKNPKIDEKEGWQWDEGDELQEDSGE